MMDWRIHRFEEVTSTNDVAFAALEKGDGRPGDVFLAKRQTAGRGTRGRAWLSEPGGLYLSAILRTPDIPIPGLWTIAGALAALDLATALGVPAGLDWPNDLVTPGGAKLGGVLAESRGLSAQGPATYVLGIGINLHGDALEGPARERIIADRPIAALLEMATSTDPEAPPEALLLSALAARTHVARQDPSALFRSFFERCIQAHRAVHVDVAGNRVTGVFQDLLPSRGLHLASQDSHGPAKWLPLAHVRSMELAQCGEQR